MARTIEQIKTAMVAQKNATPELNTLGNNSATSIYGSWLYIVAVAIFASENLFDFFKADVQTIITNTRPHTLQWYATKAKQFQYGYDLPIDSDVYDNSNVAEDDLLLSKIISYAAVVELQKGLRIKVATLNGTNLEKINAAQKLSLENYFEKIKDAGVKLQITSTDADDLLLALKIKYNPLVLNGLGARIDGTDATPVVTAVKNYLNNLPFNGVFSIQKLVDEIQAVEGVEDLLVQECLSKYGLLPFTSIQIATIPDSGYFTLDTINNFETFYEAN